MSAWRVIRESFGDMPSAQTFRARLIVIGVSWLYVAAVIALNFFVATAVARCTP